MADITVGSSALEHRSSAGAITGAGTSRAAQLMRTTLPRAFAGLYKLAGVCRLAGVPVAGYRVWATPFGVPFYPVAAAVTEEDGTFLLEYVAAGKYEVVAFPIVGDPNAQIFAYVDAVAL